MTAIGSALVIGGGIGGLSTAIALGRRGISVHLVEEQRLWTTYGVGIIQPNNTLRALDRLGLARACVEEGAAFPGWRIHDAAGAVLLEAPAPRSAAPELPAVNGIARSALHRILCDAARDAGVIVHLGVTVADLEQSGTSVAVALSDGGRGDFDLVVASDGIGSDMRSRLFGDQHAPVFTGQGVWRYNLPRPREQTWGGIHFGPSSKVGLVPLSRSEMYMFVVSAEPGNPRLGGPAMADMMRERLTGFSGPVADLSRAIVDPDEVVYRPMLHMMLPAPWHRGRVVVVGDAAHATTPHLAQGAAMAIEDGVLLGEMMERREPIEDLLSEFTERRMGRARFVVQTSSRLASGELDDWAGRPDPSLDPGAVLHDATVRLMEPY